MGIPQIEENLFVLLTYIYIYYFFHVEMFIALYSEISFTVFHVKNIKE